MNNIFLQTAYADASSTADIITATNDAFIGNINDSTEFFIWLTAIVVALALLTLMLRAMGPIFDFLKGR